jgi:hypothetical protein
MSQLYRFCKVISFPSAVSVRDANIITGIARKCRQGGISNSGKFHWGGRLSSCYSSAVASVASSLPTRPVETPGQALAVMQVRV